jgi:hypothetical protein
LASTPSCPTILDYNQAVQNLRTCLADTELASGQAHLDRMGLPIAWSGGFAVVFQVRSGHSRYAVRCFTRHLADQQVRYAALTRHLQHQQPKSFVQFSYLPHGILAAGAWWPLVKMHWVNGVRLDEALAEKVQRRDTAGLQQLAAQFLELINELETCQISHGDLQHGNILVSSRLMLVDYDGVFVPTLAGHASLEIGHRNYQHPRRGPKDYSLGLDRFAALSIYLSLLALAEEPGLWGKYHQDERLLLGAFDYADPTSSQILQTLKNSRSGLVRLLSGMLVEASLDSPAGLQSLNSLVEKVRFSPATPAAPRSAPEPPPRLYYPPNHPSKLPAGKRRSFVPGGNICTNPLCKHPLPATYWHNRDLDRIFSGELPFCSEACVEQFFDLQMCSDCTQPLTDPCLQDAALDQANAKTFYFCSEACWQNYRDQKVCAWCSKLLPETYWYSSAIDRCYGYRRRFCSETCMDSFTEKNMCAACRGALPKPAYTDRALNLKVGKQPLFCCPDCQERYKIENLCGECGQCLGKKYWFSSPLNQASGHETRFCSQDCLNKHLEQRVCDQCAALITGKPHQAADLEQKGSRPLHFCSDECILSYRREKICLQCGGSLPENEGYITYYYFDSVDQKLGFRGRFCTQDCGQKYLLPR